MDTFYAKCPFSNLSRDIMYNITMRHVHITAGVVEKL
jgi:hypothetical protein